MAATIYVYCNTELKLYENNLYLRIRTRINKKKTINLTLGLLN